MKTKFSARGFTLIEIMVALVIMSGLCIVIAQSVKSGLEGRKKIQVDLREESLVRDAMRLMVNDVGAGFHHRDYTVSNYNKVLELRKKKRTNPQAGQPTGGAPPDPVGSGAQPGQVTGGAPTTAQPPDPLASATPLPEPNQLTAFIGSNEAMTFTVRNHVRRYVDAKESDQARVAYFLRSCRSEGKTAGMSSCLVRQETTNPTDQFPLSPADEDDAKGVVLVRNITEFKLRYITAGMTDFVDSWDSTPTTTNAESKDKFPDAVQITMGIHDKLNPESKHRILTWLAPIRSSNNLDEADKTATAKEAEAASGTGKPGTTGQQK